MFFFMIFLASCTPDDMFNENYYSSAVLSSVVTEHDPDSLSLKLNFFLLDKETGEFITNRSIFSTIILDSYYFTGSLQDFKSVETSSSQNYSCALLLDDIFSRTNYSPEYSFGEPNYTEVFIRKFFKNAGNSNPFLFSYFEDKVNPLTIVGDNYTLNPEDYDLPIAGILYSRPLDCNTSACIDSLPLLESMNSLMNYINQNAPAENRNLILMYSRNLFNRKGYSMVTLIQKALQYHIKVSFILGNIGNYEINWDNEGENFYFVMASLTGGMVYQIVDYDLKDLSLLSSRLKNIFEGNIKYYETTWKLKPKTQIIPVFQPGVFYDDVKLNLQIQNGKEETELGLPFGVFY